MADVINTSDENDTEGPPPYPDPFAFPKLPAGYGEIVCKEHRWKSGSNWGIAIGDFNRGEVVGDNVTLQARTSESNDTEDLEGPGFRAVKFELRPGNLLDATMKVRLKITHTLALTAQCKAMSNVEKNPPAVAAASSVQFNQFGKVDLRYLALVRADKQTVFHTEKITGTKSAGAKLKVEVAPDGLPKGSVSADAQNQVARSETIATVRQSIVSPDIHHAISIVEAQEDLGRGNLESEAYIVIVKGLVSADVGDTDGFADASLVVNCNWFLDLELLDGEGLPVIPG